MTVERRLFDVKLQKVEKRNEHDDGNGEGHGEEQSPEVVISGHAAVFNSRSEDLGGFVEEIAPGAFDGVLGDDVRCLFNHDPNHILGRSTSGTLSLTVDGNGLTYRCVMPDTQLARDLVKSMERGDISQSSFAFEVAEDEFDRLEDDGLLRTITKIKRLHDVSPVTYPAYPDASSEISQRALDKAKQMQRKFPADGLREWVELKKVWRKRA